MKIIMMFVIALLYNVSTLAQEIKGIVKNKDSQEKLPFVLVYNIDEKTSTLSNEEGLFNLKVNRFPTQILFSSLAYKKDTIVFQNIDGKTIFLEANPISLNEVTVSNLGYKLITRAVEKSQKERKLIKNKSGFYRQLIHNDSVLTQLHETFYGLELSTHKIEKFKINHARYAKIPSNETNLYLGFGNFSYLILAQKTFFESKVDEKSVLFPLRKDVLDYYSVNLKQITENETEKIAELYCTPSVPKNYPAFEGSIFIDVNTAEIKQIQGKIKHSLGAEADLPMLRTSNFVHSFEIHLDKGLFTFIKDELVFEEYMKKIDRVRKVKVSGFLHIYEQNGEANLGKYKAINIGTDDLKDIKKTKYDALFWRNNPIIKRTPLEENAINLFEQKDIFTNTVEK